MPYPPTTHENLIRVLTAGFASVICLMLAAGFVGVRNIKSIQINAARLAAGQAATNRLISELQKEQDTLSAVFYTLAREPETVDDDQIEADLNNLDHDMTRIAAESKGAQNEVLFVELSHASGSFSTEARRLLTQPGSSPTLASRDLFRLHEQVLWLISRILGSRSSLAVQEQSEINHRSEQLIRESAALLGASLLLALGFSVLTVRMSAQLFRHMESQTSELSRVSWHMLQDQESIARRFSHELHDELGQSLMAVRANLSALVRAPDSGRRMKDTIALVDEAIGNVRQLSQLLRPTILDDFGLEAGLRWLCDGFTTRTGIQVDFQSNLEERLADLTETHLFRIAQEALTNVARHAEATQVCVELCVEANSICLIISDDGKGFNGQPDGLKSLGMIGMRARARAVGGNLLFKRSNRGGLRVEVEVPLHTLRYERDTHPVG